MYPRSIDIMEEDVLTNVIILQTVLEEVKHRSSSVYKKLKDIITNTHRKFYIFVNEHHKYVENIVLNSQSIMYCYILLFLRRDTYIERNPGESANDRSK